MYACTEHLMLGISNPDGDTMTLMDDNLIFEFYEDHSVITNLFNYTLPLIRYRMSDILRPVSAPGAPRIVIQNLVGRTEQMPVFVNGDRRQGFHQSAHHQRDIRQGRDALSNADYRPQLVSLSDLRRRGTRR